MKLNDIKHVTDLAHDNPTLQFVCQVSQVTGELEYTCRQPYKWDNVARLCGMLFYAWDNDNPREGCVYLGQFVGR